MLLIFLGVARSAQSKKSAVPGRKPAGINETVTGVPAKSDGPCSIRHRRLSLRRAWC